MCQTDHAVEVGGPAGQGEQLGASRRLEQARWRRRRRWRALSRLPVFMLVVAVFAGCSDPTMPEVRAQILNEHAQSFVESIEQLAASEDLDLVSVDPARSTDILGEEDHVDLRIRVVFDSGCRWVGVGGIELQSDHPRWNADLTSTDC